MHIGLIGGIGVAATMVYYQRLTAAAAARGVPRLDLTIVHGEIHELIRNNLADRKAEQAQAFLPLVTRLKDAGCDCAALSSLGAHFCFEELAALSPLPLVSAVTPLDAYFVEQGIKRVGLLGTRVVMRSRLYGQLAHTEALALDDEIETLGPNLPGGCRGRHLLGLAAGSVPRCRASHDRGRSRRHRPCRNRSQPGF
jgi:aspartate racemase